MMHEHHAMRSVTIKESSMPRKIQIATALLFAMSIPAMAQSGSMQGMGMQNSGMQGSMANMMGSHMMPAKVTMVDPRTGLVDVTSEGMRLKLHFPPRSVANLRPGDAITIHMAFSKSS